MEKYIIKGGKKLYGEVEISGGKNAVGAIIPAAVMVQGICTIENVPSISDVKWFIEILTYMGAKVTYLNKTTIQIDSTNINSYIADYEQVRKMRASYYLMGALLSRFNNAKVGLPGGCNFGDRPIDLHIKGFELLGANVVMEHGIVNISAEKLTGTSVYLDIASVGATINIMLAAVRAEGQTIIENAAKEPHIVDVANFLNAMGADIKGAGTDIIKIKGVDQLYGGTYTIIPDQIEAGTYMALAAAVGGKVTVKNIIPKHMESISAKLSEAGVDIEEFDDSIIVSRTKPLNKVNIKTLPYPGFPTDMQPQMTALLCLAKGTSIITEGIFDHRFRYVDELRRLGAKLEVDGKVCIVEGIDNYLGAVVHACDLRAGIALVIAGLAAEGITEVQGIEHIERGYEELLSKLQALGASIKKISTNETGKNLNNMIG